MISVLLTQLRRVATPVVALVIIASLYGMASLPDLTPHERKALAQRFRFTQLILPELPGYPKRNVRNVNPSLAHISGWISSVGAAVALNDLDGDGLPNDVCYVDTRIDQIVVAPVPGTGKRYTPFVLTPQTLPFDQSTMAPMGCLPGDLNEDGQMDLVAYYWGRTPIAFMRSTDSYHPIEIVSHIERWFTNAATLADLDGDGHVDLLITNYFQDGAKILDVDAKKSESMQHSMSRAFNAGTTHFFLWSEAEVGDQPTVDYKRVNGVLQDQVNTAWTLAVGAADLDGDLLPELYFANDFGPDRLLHNRSAPGDLQFAVLEGERRFTTPASKVLGKDSFKGMGIDFGDLNGDGFLDMYVSNIAAEYALEESHFAYVSTGHAEQMKRGIAPYIDHSERLGLSRSSWSWDAKLADFDNDGILEALQATGFVKGEIDRWPELQELALGNDELLADPSFWPRFQPGDDLSGHVHNPFFVRDSDGRYYDIAADLGLAQPTVSRGIATADVDGDGDLDYAVANQWEPSFFYRNDCSSCGMALGLSLLLPVNSDTRKQFRVYPGRPTNLGRPAIGASAKVVLPDGKILVAQVDGGNGHSGKRSPDLHFGLGTLDTKQTVQVELRWRDAKGIVRRQELQLASGWHTVMLGENTGTLLSQRTQLVGGR